MAAPSSCACWCATSAATRSPTSGRSLPYRRNAKQQRAASASTTSSTSNLNQVPNRTMDTSLIDPNPCRVIGVLDDGAASLNATALAWLRSADVVIGGARTLALLKNEFKAGAICRDLTGSLKEVPEWVRAARADNLCCVVLATGDPLCHGIAPYLAQHLCVQALEILPNLSTLQLACARIGLAWQDARVVSVHARDAGEWSRGATPGHGLYALA